MRASRNWFGKMSGQQVFSKVTDLPTVAMAGPSGPSGQRRKPVRKKDDEGRDLFVVGKTVVGGDEVVA